MRKNVPPTATASIENLSHDGRGVAHLQGKTTFIDGALPHETVTFQYTRKHSRFDEGQVLDILTPSPHRITPRCQHFALCGGCSLQHLDPEKALQHKMHTLLEQLQHFAGIQPTECLPPLTDLHWEYRHKARIGVKYVEKKQKVLIGFREKNGRYITDIQRCEVLHPSVGLLFPALQALVSSLSCYRALPQIEVAIGDTHTALIFRHMQPLTQDDLQSLNTFGRDHHLDIYLQPQGINSIHKLYPAHTPERLSYTLPHYHLELFFHPTDFTQVNLSLNRRLIVHALTLLAPQKNERILDLFCGIGNFTLPLATLAQHVVGVEGEKTLVDRATQNAQHNHLTNIEFHTANLFDECIDFPWARQAQYDKLLLDPPRSGSKEIAARINVFAPKRIVYVSCNPATLARDAHILVQQGYQLKQAGVIDMFPHTTHVESIGVFDRR